MCTHIYPEPNLFCRINLLLLQITGKLGINCCFEFCDFYTALVYKITEFRLIAILVVQSHKPARGRLSPSLFFRSLECLRAKPTLIPSLLLCHFTPPVSPSWPASLSPQSLCSLFKPLAWTQTAPSGSSESSPNSGTVSFHYSPGLLFLDPGSASYCSLSPGKHTHSPQSTLHSGSPVLI